MSVTRTARLGRRVRAVVTGAAIAVVALSAATGSAEAARSINWYDFARTDCSGSWTWPTYAPSGEDRIRLVEQCASTGVPLDQIEIVFNTAPTVTWRKGIEFDRVRCVWSGCGYQFVTGMYLQDADHGPVVRRLSTRDLMTTGYPGRLRFGKAKFFGIYTDMYDLHFDLPHLVGGRRYTFTWLSDS